jgi:hypothetical protein
MPNGTFEQSSSSRTQLNVRARLKATRGHIHRAGIPKYEKDALEELLDVLLKEGYLSEPQIKKRIETSIKVVEARGRESAAIHRAFSKKH